MVGGDEVHGAGIDTVAGVIGGQALPQEDMTQVAAAIDAEDLGSLALLQDGGYYIRISCCPGYAMVSSWQQANPWAAKASMIWILMDIRSEHL